MGIDDPAGSAQQKDHCDDNDECGDARHLCHCEIVCGVGRDDLADEARVGGFESKLGWKPTATSALGRL